MTNKTFRAHPITITRVIRPYLFVLILPFIRAIIQYFTKGEINGFLLLELIAFSVILTMAILGWLSIKISVDNRRVTVQKGVFIKSCAVIDISRVSSIALKQNVLDMLLGSVDCAINTEAGTPKKYDFNIKMRLCDAKSFYNMVYGTEKMQKIKFSAWRIALLAATTSSAATGIIVGVPIIYQASDLLGVAISDMLLNEINHISSRFDNIFPPIVNTVTVMFFVAYGVAFATSFLKNINFRLKSGKKSIEVRSGLLVRKMITFKKTKVNNICFEQTPLLRLIKRYLMRVSIGGYGDDKGQKAVVIPVARRKTLEKNIKIHFPFLYIAGRLTKPAKTKTTLARFMFLPTISAMIAIATTLCLVLVFPYFDRLILFVLLVFLTIDTYYVSVCYRNYQKGRVCLGDNLLAVGSRGLTVREIYCDKNKIGVIRIRQTFIDRHFNTCNAKFTVRGEGADSVTVRKLNKKEIIENINQAYNLNINA